MQWLAPLHYHRVILGADWPKSFQIMPVILQRFLSFAVQGAHLVFQAGEAVMLLAIFVYGITRMTFQSPFWAGLAVLFHVFACDSAA